MCLAVPPTVTLKYLAVIARVAVRCLTAPPGETVSYLAVTPGIAA